ncbi:MAG TPA: hypothetical protein PKD55_00275 [Bellilinea sp.]|nr:hypothetical protein [Bellilinea sp.]
MAGNAVERKRSRVFITPQRAGPANAPEYLMFSAPGALAWPQGDVTKHKAPSPTRRDRFETIGRTQDAQENATISVTVTDQLAKSRMFELVKQRCAFDVYIVHGLCQDPQDLNGGWSTGKVRILEQARFTDYSTDELGGMDESADGIVMEELSISAENVYEVLPMSYIEKAKSQVVAQVVKVLFPDSVQCGDCGDVPSDGISKAAALVSPAGSSPGTLPEVVATKDGYTTVIESAITTMTSVEEVSDMANVSDYLVVLQSATTGAIHYINLEDMLNGVGTWTEVTTGLVASGAPKAISSVGPRDTIIVGNGGYIYKMVDATAGVAVMDAGVATSENLNAVHMFDLDVAVAVGENNAVVYTFNGQDFQAVTGPEPGAALNTVWVKGKKEWFIGTATGKLWYTRDAGINWIQKRFVGDESGEVHDIRFVSDAIGYLAHETTAPAGRILRTIDGGFSWFVVPEGQGSIPVCDAVYSIAVPEEDPNVIIAGGLADNAADGILIKGSA